MRMKYLALIMFSASLFNACGKQDTGFVHKWEQTNIDDEVRVDLIQNVRPIVSDSFVVPDMAYTKDAFVPEHVIPKLDILVIIDNSGSMSEEQAQLATKLKPLLEKVEDAEWAINIVTTDSPCSRAYIKKGTTDPIGKFEAAVSAGTSGSATELGLEMMVRSLKGECPNNNGTPEIWVREESTLAVLIVSDEDDSGSGSGPYSVEGAMKFIKSIRDPGQNLRIYGIIDPEGTSCSSAFAAPQYHDVIRRTKGISGSICAPSYEGTLKQISEDVASILETEFFLKHAPLSDTLVVSVDGNPVQGKYTITGQKVSFDKPPPDGAIITVNYAYSEVRNLTLSEKPDVESLEVLKDGVPEETTQFYFTGSSNMVAFNHRLLPGTVVQANYKAEAALARSFTLGQVDDPKKIRCESAAGDVGEFDYDPKTGAISFRKAPPEGVRISCVVHSKI
jgi:hypothetical protein